MKPPIEGPAVYTDLAGLSALKRQAGQDDPQALREAARQFESLFTRMMLRSMREAGAALGGDSLLGSDQQNFYREMFDDQLAMEMSRGKGLGLAEMLIEQLTRGALKPGDGEPIKEP